MKMDCDYQVVLACVQLFSHIAYMSIQVYIYIAELAKRKVYE